MSDSNQIVKTAPEFQYDTTVIRADQHDFLCLTDMWRAAGSDPSKRPVDWMKLPGTRDFVDYIASDPKVGKSHDELFRIVRGGIDPSTWAHWQIGMAYAKYLSPPFHAWCNTVVRTHYQQTENLLDLLRANQQTMQQAIMALANLPAQMQQHHHEMLAVITTALGQRPTQPRLDTVSMRQLREALGVFAERRGLSKLDAFKIVRREQGVRSWRTLPYEQAQAVRAWMLQTLPQQAAPEAPPVRAVPSMDPLLDKVLSFIPPRTTDHGGKPVKGPPEPPFWAYPKEALAEIHRRCGVNGVEWSLPEGWLEQTIRREGIHGKLWADDSGALAERAIKYLVLRAIEFHRPHAGAPTPFAGDPRG